MDNCCGKPAQSGWKCVRAPHHEGPCEGLVVNCPELMKPSHTLNRDGSVAVAADWRYNPDMTACPRGPKVLLLGAGGVATVGEYRGEPFWVEWSPLPRSSK